MKRTQWFSASCAALALLLAGCGTTAAPQTTKAAESASGGAAGNLDTKLPKQQTDGGGGAEDGPSNPQPEYDGERFQVYEVDVELTVKPEDTKDMLEKLKASISEKNGYITSLKTSKYDMEKESEDETNDGYDSSEDGTASAVETEAADGEDGYSDDYDGYYDDYDDYYSYYDSHWTSMEVVLPSDQADLFVKDLSSDYKVTDQAESLLDYTLEYRSLLDRETALKDEEQRLISMLEDARSSGKNRSSDSDSDYLEKVIQLENNLWETRKELNECRFGSGSDSYSYYYEDVPTDGLYDYEDVLGKTMVSLEIYVKE